MDGWVARWMNDFPRQPFLAAPSHHSNSDGPVMDLVHDSNCTMVMNILLIQ